MHHTRESVSGFSANNANSALKVKRPISRQTSTALVAAEASDTALKALMPAASALSAASAIISLEIRTLVDMVGLVIPTVYYC